MKVYNANLGVGDLDLIANTFTGENGKVTPMEWATVEGLHRITLVTRDAKTWIFTRLEDEKP